MEIQVKEKKLTRTYCFLRSVLKYRKGNKQTNTHGVTDETNHKFIPKRECYKVPVI